MNLTMKLTKLLRTLWPAFLCAVVWQLLQFAPSDQWWWLQKAMGPLTTMMIFLAVWRYSDRQQSTTWLLLVALVLFAVADSLVAFLPFSHLIVGLGGVFAGVSGALCYKFVAPHLCLCEGSRQAYKLGIAASYLHGQCNNGIFDTTQRATACRKPAPCWSNKSVCCCTYGADDERDSGSSDRLSATVERG